MDTCQADVAGAAQAYTPCAARDRPFNPGTAGTLCVKRLGHFALPGCVGSLILRLRSRWRPPAADPRFRELGAAPREQRLEEEVLRRPGDQSAAPFTEGRGVEPGVHEPQARRTLRHNWRIVTSASCRGGCAGCPCVGKRARKTSSVNSASSASATRRYRRPLGKAARATRAVSRGRGPIGTGRNMVHHRVSI
jgi:hypothetical protein